MAPSQRRRAVHRDTTMLIARVFNRAEIKATIRIMQDDGTIDATLARTLQSHADQLTAYFHSANDAALARAF